MERIGDGDPYSTTAFTTTEEESTTNPRTQSPPTNIDALPDELLSEILVRNSAEDIEERVRLVCKRWCRTVHRRAFFTAHFHRHGPSSGLLLPGGAELRPTFVGATLGGKIKVSELSYDFESSSILASCNGLILAVDNFEEHSPHIVNPETETRFDLPPLTDAMRGPKRHYNRYGIAYVAASMEYKVVATYSPNQDSMDRECSILTVGVDNTWRRVATQQLSPQVNWLLLYHHPIITEGFMHWADSDENTVLTLNVETEVFVGGMVQELVGRTNEYNVKKITSKRIYEQKAESRKALFPQDEIRPGSVLGFGVSSPKIKWLRLEGSSTAKPWSSDELDGGEKLSSEMNKGEVCSKMCLDVCFSNASYYSALMGHYVITWSLEEVEE